MKLIDTLLLLSAFAATPVAGAQIEESELFAADGAPGDQFGWGLALDGSLAVVGAHFHDALGAGAGAAWVYGYTPAGWVELQKLTAGDATPDAGFGNAIALSGTTLVIGASTDPQTGNQGGAAYVFERQGSGWVERQKLLPDSTHAAWFGRGLALDGDTLAVGAPRDDDAAPRAGAVYVYTRSGGAWVLQQKVLPQGVDGGERAGFRVALEGDVIVAGAPDDEQSGSQIGRAFVFRRTGGSWTQEAELTAPDGEVQDFFGWAVALSGDTAAVGAWGDDDSGFQGGAVYVYEHQAGTWSFTHKLTPPPGVCCAHFGLALDVEGDRLVAGADVFGQPVSPRGAAYVFEREVGAWAQTGFFQPAGQGAEDFFGAGVSLSGERVLVGARNAASPVPVAQTGSAWTFVLPELFGPFCSGDGTGTACPCANEGAPGEGCTNSTGAGATLVHAGSPSVAADDLFLVAGQLPPQPVLLFAGDAVLGGGAGVPFGDGLRCAGGSVVRLGTTAPDATGQADWGPGLPALGGFQPGDERFFQAWYRDPQGGPCASGFNLTNAVAIRFVP